MTGPREGRNFSGVKNTVRSSAGATDIRAANQTVPQNARRPNAQAEFSPVLINLCTGQKISSCSATHCF